MKIQYEVLGAQSGEEISKVLSTYPLGKRIAQTVIDVVNGLGQQGRITDGYAEDDGTKVFQVSTPEFDYRVGLDGKPTRDALTDETVGELHAISFAQDRVLETGEPEMTVRICIERTYAAATVTEEYTAQIRANYTRFLEVCRAHADAKVHLDARILTAEDFKLVPLAEAWTLAHSWGVLLRKLPGKISTQPEENLTKLNAASVLLDVALVTYLDAAQGLVDSIPDARKTNH